MKRFAAILLILTAIVSVYAGVYEGWGAWGQTATTTWQKLDGFTANKAKVTNDGSEAMFVLPNMLTSNACTLRQTAGTTIRIETNSFYEFDCAGKSHVFNIWYRTTNSTSAFSVQAF